MKNKRSANIIKLSFLFLGINFLILTNAFVYKGQSKTSEPNLINTGWKASSEQMNPNKPYYFDFVFDFKESGKVRACIIFKKFMPKPKLKYDPLTDQADSKLATVYELQPAEYFTYIGTYKQSENVVRLEFSSVLLIDAIIKGKSMEGVVAMKQSNDKARLTADRISSYTRQEKFTCDSTGGTKKDSPVSSTELFMEYTPLSMEERLPQQLGQFKRTDFDTYTYTAPKPGDTKGDALQEAVNASRGKHIGWNGEVEGASAKYGEITVFITKYKDSAKATNSMQKSISSEFIVKREAMKNRAGQAVGELVVSQSPKKVRDTMNELVMFTYGLYEYNIYSTNWGDAQKLQKLLPLE